MEIRERGKRRRIDRALDAAREIIIEQGVEGLHMRALADRADLAVRTLYNQFGSKAEVVTALAARELDDLTKEISELELEDPLERSRAVITVSIDRFHGRRELLRPLMAAAYSGEAAEGCLGLIHQARALQEEALGMAMAARQLGDTAPASHLAHQVLASYNQAASAWALHELGHRDFRTQALHAWACLLLGFARGAARGRLIEEIQTLAPAMERVVRRAEAGERAAVRVS